MKIIQVQTQAEAAGAQRISDMVGEGLRAQGHQVRTVFMYRKTDAYDADPYADFVSRDRPGGRLDEMKAAWGLIRYLRKERPDAVITYQYWGNLFGTIGARLAGARRIVANQSGKPMTEGILGVASRLDRWIGTWGWYHRNVVNSAWTEAQFAAYPRSYRDRLKRIDHGVQVATATLSKAEARRRFGVPEDAPLVISTGRQTREKNQGVLVDLLARVPNVHVAIAGVGPYRDEMLADADERGVRDRLHMVGELNSADMANFLTSGDIFAFPSLFETFGLAAAEGAIAGLPVVANDLEVLHGVLRTETGEPAALFVPMVNGAELAEAVERLIADPALGERLSLAGRSLAARYSPAAMSAAYERLLTN